MLETATDLAKYFHLHRNTISRLKKLGMPYKKLGGTFRYDLDEVEEWLKNLTIKEKRDAGISEKQAKNI